MPRSGRPLLMEKASRGKCSCNAYESRYRSSGNSVTYDFGALSGIAYNFNPNGAIATRQSISIGRGADIILDLQWDQPFASVSPSSGGARTQLDLVLYDVYVLDRYVVHVCYLDHDVDYYIIDGDLQMNTVVLYYLYLMLDLDSHRYVMAVLVWMPRMI